MYAKDIDVVAITPTPAADVDRVGYLKCRRQDAAIILTNITYRFLASTIFP